MKSKPLGTNLKLQVIDELADVLNTFQHDGRPSAQTALRRISDAYPQIHQYARVMWAFSAVKAFIDDPARTDVLEVADLLGHADIAIAAEGA